MEDCKRVRPSALADANGLTASSVLTADQVLTIPNKVTNIHNNAGTFRPYNPGEAIGDLNPTIPATPKPPKKKHGCGGLGGIIAAVVSIAVTIIAGPLDSVAAAALGNLAGQVTGMALGVQKGFSFKSFATSVISAGITQGVLGTPETPTAFANKLGSLGNALGQYGAVAARAVVGNVINQGVGNLTGAQKGFSWSSVAIAGVGAAVGAAVTDKFGLTTTDSIGRVSPALKTDNFGADLGRSFVNAGANALTQLAVRGGRINWQQVATDALTNAVGTTLGRKGLELIQAQREAMGNANRTGGSIDFNNIKRPGVQFSQSQADSLFTNLESQIPQDDYAFNLQSYTQQLQFELAAQDEQQALYSGASLLPTAGGAGGPVRTGPTMVMNRGWDAALNIASDPTGFLEPLQGTMNALNELNEARARSQVEETRTALYKLGVKNLPRNLEALNGNGEIVTDYKATGKMLAGAYEDFVRDNRLRATWGDNYKDIRIGKSKFTPQQFEEVSLSLQQDTMNKAVVEGMDKLSRGKLTLQKDSVMLTLGTYADREIRETLRRFYKSEGLIESSVSKYAAVNRKITNGLVSSIPDLRLGANLYPESTLALKNLTTEQLMIRAAINPNAYHIIVRPTVKFVPNFNTGSYVIPSRDFGPINLPTVPKRGGKF